MDTILFITDLHAGSRLAELDGIREVAKAQGWHVEEIELQRLQQPFAKVLDYWRPVGCIVEGSSNLLPEASSLAGLPVVYLDPGEALWTDPAAFAVMNDDAALAEAAACAAIAAAFLSSSAFAFSAFSSSGFVNGSREKPFRLMRTAPVPIIAAKFSGSFLRSKIAQYSR